MHGGAGAVAGRDYSVVEKHMAELAAECGQRLEAGARALDVVEYAVVELESSGMYVAGRGSAPNSAGYVELDASIMDGRTRDAGAVAAVVSVVNPVTAARRVMEDTPHVMLCGKGAREFATRQGLELVEDPGSYYKLPIGVYRHELGERGHGTVGAVALDQSGGLAAATSTGGTFGKLEGRVGDSPLIGAGTWADDGIAVSCTGIGEHIIRAGGALAVACKVRAGSDTETAIDEMLAEVKSLGGDGGVIAVTRTGEIAMRYNSQGMKRASIGSELALFVKTFA
ncbi:MAG TPA: isoaspartyl peptidase/L-asparaginase [Woeseiaceae bacterium]|nr:isoaspartyl peptidase/L-asparaginase [Woeseiaceae bacterium]